MNNRKYKSNPEELLNQGKAIMSSYDESRFHFSVFAVNMVLSGFPASEIGKMAGVSKVAVTGWVKAVDEKGFDALRSKGRTGRPSSLYSFINNKYGISMSVRQCQRIFHELGFSLIRPQPYPSKGYEDTEERNEFKKNAPK